MSVAPVGGVGKEMRRSGKKLRTGGGDARDVPGGHAVPVAVDRADRRSEEGHPVYLSAVLVPPLAQREAIARLLTDAGARMAAPTADRPRSWRRPRAASASPVTVPLVPLPVERMAVHVTRFGFVDPESATRLQVALERDALAWTAPTVRVVGRLSTHGTDEQLHLDLDGEVDGLRSVFREITDSARRAGFMLDRRSFVPVIPVADLDPAVSDEALATLVAALEDFAGEPWQARVVTLAKLGFGPDDRDLREVASIALGGTAG